MHLLPWKCIGYVICTLNRHTNTPSCALRNMFYVTIQKWIKEYVFFFLLVNKNKEKTTSLVHRECTRKAKAYPKIHKSTKSKTEGMARPLKVVLHSNKDRRKTRFNLIIKCSSPSKILLFRSLHMFHIIYKGIPKEFPEFPTVGSLYILLLCYVCGELRLWVLVLIIPIF